MDTDSPEINSFSRLKDQYHQNAFESLAHVDYRASYYADLSGVERVEWRDEGSTEWHTSTNYPDLKRATLRISFTPASLSATSRTVVVRAVDNAGNVSSEKSYTVSNHVPDNVLNAMNGSLSTSGDLTKVPVYAQKSSSTASWNYRYIVNHTGKTAVLRLHILQADLERWIGT